MNLTTQYSYQTLLSNPLKLSKINFFATNQYIRASVSTHLTRNFCSPFHALIVPRWK